MSYYENRIKELEHRIEQMAWANRLKAIPVEAQLIDRITELNKENARLKAENERLRKAGQWQPIETAPKDGTWFIAGFDGDLPSRHAWAAMCIWECGRFEVQETPDQPDYWMPLPKPQKEGNAQP